MANGSGFFSELKRRHVWRVAAAYAVAAWLLIQVATQVFPFFDIPGWVVRVVVVLLALGFPVVIALAWVYELTPEGIRRTEAIDSAAARSSQASRRMRRRLNTLLITLLMVAVAFLGVRLAWVQRAPAKTTAATPAVPAPVPRATESRTQPVPARSVAVLPFQNLSDEKSSEYFVAGMQDLILTKLAGIADLKVISRASTQQYATRPANLKAIGEQLGVAAILEGSVQRQGNRVLINLQLIDARTDSHLWAQAYHRTLDDVFGVEGEIADKVARSLNATLSSDEAARLASVPTRNRAAYDLYLRAEFQASKGFTNYDLASMRAAIPLYRQAIAEDPGFALAYAQLSYVQSQLAWFGGAKTEDPALVRQARADAERALELAPALPAAHLALGYSEYWGKGDYADALQSFATALELRPNDAGALAAQGFVERRSGHFDEGIAALERAFALDPRNSWLAFETGSTYMMVYRYADAGDWLQRALAIDPANRNARAAVSASALLTRGDIVAALAAAQGDDPVLKQRRVALLTLQRKYAEALELLGSVPDTPDNFPGMTEGSISPKALQLAELRRLMGDAPYAARLYAQTLPSLREQVARQQGIKRAVALQVLANAELRAGNLARALEAAGKVEGIVRATGDSVYGPILLQQNATVFAGAARPELAVPQLEKALSTPGIGMFYSPVMLWLDPAWDAIRDDARFKALLARHARFRPAVTYTAAGAVAPTAG